MATVLTLSIQGLEEARRALHPKNFAKAVATIRLGVANEVRAEIAAYPGPPQYPLRWKTEKQRRWFFYALDEGIVQAPYVRQFALNSQRLGPSWTVVDEGNRTVVGTHVTYAPYVQSHERQQPFHKETGWKTDKQAVKAVARSGIIDEVVREVLREYRPAAKGIA